LGRHKTCPYFLCFVLLKFALVKNNPENPLDPPASRSNKLFLFSCFLF
jgi:hypothetical protein